MTSVLAALAAAAVSLGMAAVCAAATQSEQIYAGGRTYAIDTSEAVFLQADQDVLDAAARFYIIGFPVKPGTSGPITLPSGYRPQNDGQPAPIPYHDHVAANLLNPLRHVIDMRYSRSYAYSRRFVPLRTVAQLRAAEGTGKLAVVDPGAPDPYQHITPTVLVRPVICSHRPHRHR